MVYSIAILPGSQAAITIVWHSVVLVACSYLQNPKDFEESLQ